MSIARDAFIDGAWVAVSKRFAVRDPYDGSIIAEVTDCDDATIDRAIEAAARAFQTWRKTLAPERGKLLRALGDRMLADEARLAEEARNAEEARAAEELRHAEEPRDADEARAAEEARHAE
jgi:succinate-semialdehyde dehydrogenase/glutarate-semialdehyde dehydrogenase